jgi:hypothetical protein
MKIMPALYKGLIVAGVLPGRLLLRHHRLMFRPVDLGSQAP